MLSVYLQSSRTGMRAFDKALAAVLYLLAVAGAAHAASDAQWVMVDVRGAVARPGPVALPMVRATADRAVELLGGPVAQAYPFATLLLRPREAPPNGAACLATGDRHALLLLRDDPVLGSDDALVSALQEGRVQRLPARLHPFGRLGSDRGRATILRTGDILALPQRSQRVYVVAADGRVLSLAHAPRQMAVDYLKQLPAQDVAPLRDYVLHDPDGRVSELAVESWNAAPTTVPPGAMLTPRVGCLPVVD